MPSRYEAARPAWASPGERLARAVTHLAVRHGPRIAERLIFGSAPLWPSALLRVVLSRWRRAHLDAIAGGFDRGFYLQQMPDASRRTRAARALLLHYATIGCLERRAPAPAFDVAFYRRNVPALPPLADPLRDWREHGRKQSLPRNRFESSPGAVGDLGDMVAEMRGGAERSEPEEATPATSRASSVRDPGRGAHLPLSACGAPPPLGEARRAPAEDGAALIFHHARGGGSETFLDRFEADLRRQGHRILRLRAVSGTATLAVHDGPASEVLDLACEPQLLAFARRHGVRRLIVNHLIDRPPAMLDWVRALGTALGCGYDVILHDYYALCPRVQMVTGRGRFCDGAAPPACGRCVAAWGAESEHILPLEWRRVHLDFLAGAARLVAPSSDLAIRLQRFLPGHTIDVWAPESEADLPIERRPHLDAGEILRVATLGALNVPKGVRILRALADRARRCDAPLAFTVIGPCAETRALRRLGVEVGGRYRDADLDRLIDAAAPHLVFLPAIWPETWSFVLTAALRRALPVAVFDIGAPAERLRRLQRGHVLPLELSRQPADLLQALLALRRQWLLPA